MLDAVVATQPRAYAAAVYGSLARAPAAEVRRQCAGSGALGTVARFSRNETIFNEGDEARYCYRVIDGAVRLSKVMLDGRRQIVEFLMPGDLFAVDADDRYSLTAEALGNAVLTRYSRPYFQRLTEDVPELRREMTASLKRDLAAAHHHLLMLGRQSAKERLASFLLLLVTRRSGEQHERVDLPMSRQDIADYLGLTIETVCRTLADLKRLNVIATPERHYAVIRNPNALRAIASGMN